MKMIITPEEVKNLTGKFIIQISASDPNPDITKDWNFWMEKRISFVCGLKWMGFFYEHKSFETEADFVSFFNDYYPDKKGDRFHRLLTYKELEFVCQKMKERQFE